MSVDQPAFALDLTALTSPGFDWPMSELDAYDYTLPPELIAQFPLRQRTDARLLVVDRRRRTIDHFHVRDLPELLSSKDVLVLNDTKVVAARLEGFRTRTGGRWTGLFLRDSQAGLWQVLGKTRGKLEPGESVTLLDRAGRPSLQLQMLTRLERGVWAARPQSPATTWEILEQVGRTPLPPYIRGGEMDVGDEETYQTVYAEKPGAVAAPTAGLHFTPGLLERIRARGVDLQRITLHVGQGTFRPIDKERLAEHLMHEEWGELTPEVCAAIRQRREQGGSVVAVGTTVVRVLETAARSGTLKPWSGETNLFIRPPYQFQAVDVLMTNFHLPRTTLLVLVRTFGGDPLIQKAYAEAIREEYRFYSYGDAMLIL